MHASEAPSPGLPGEVDSSPSKQLAELLLCEPRVSDYACHCVRVHRIVPRNRHNSRTVGHHSVLRLPRNRKSRSLQCLDGPEMRDACNLAHNLRWDLDFAEFVLTRKLPRNRDILLNRVSDVRQSLFFSLPLGPAAGQPWTRHAVAFFRPGQRNRILHAVNVPLPRILRLAYECPAGMAHSKLPA